MYDEEEVVFFGLRSAPVPGAATASNCGAVVSNLVRSPL